MCVCIGKRVAERERVGTRDDLSRLPGWWVDMLRHHGNQRSHHWCYYQRELRVSVSQATQQPASSGTLAERERKRVARTSISLLLSTQRNSVLLSLYIYFSLYMYMYMYECIFTRELIANPGMHLHYGGKILYLYSPSVISSFPMMSQTGSYSSNTERGKLTTGIRCISYLHVTCMDMILFASVPFAYRATNNAYHPIIIHNNYYENWFLFHTYIRLSHYCLYILYIII